METRLDTFNGWQMRATVASRLTSKGEAKYYIVEPVTYKEFSVSGPLNQAVGANDAGPFDSSDEAFSTAFRGCRRAIEHVIRFRNRRSSR